MNKHIIKILICGADKKTASILQDALGDEDYTFQYFEDNEEAIQHMSWGAYQALLIGLNTHVVTGSLDGLRAIPIMRKIDPEVPIIAIAFDDSLEVERKARMAGIFYYLTKPLDVDEIKLAVTDALSKFE